MNKNELVRAMAEKAEISIKDAGFVFDTFIECLYEGLDAGEKVQISGLGTFEMKTRQAREGVNPKTGEKIVIEETTVPVLKFSKTFKDRLI